MAIISKEETVKLLRLEEGYEEIIELLIPEVEADFLRIRNKAFETDDLGEIIYPDGSKLVVSEMIGYLLKQKFGVQSESIGSYSFSAEEMIEGYPKSIVGKIKRFVKFI